MDIKCVFVFVIVCTIVRYSECLVCYGCSSINDVSDCNKTVECQEAQSCFFDSRVFGQTTKFSLGCRDNQNCGGSQNTAVNLIGRDITTRQSQDCYECCSVNNCNKQLCRHPKPTACIDDAKADCSWLSTVFNVCNDIQHAKTTCPKFCGLCTLVDGNWASWSEWSTCDVTCGNGSQNRIRTCTDPAPVDGGLDCAGYGKESKECTKQLCPVHGGWTKWSNWESCSVTCDEGIQKRHRNCTNPAPDRFGDHCFGDTMDDRLCLPGPCSNGAWAEWTMWSSCTASCGTGVKSRTRSCSNPRPSSHGRYCEGSPFDVTSCSLNECQPPDVAFMSMDPVTSTYSANQTIVFSVVKLNDGNGYDNTTGVFTAPISGTYLFNVQLSIAKNDLFYYAIVYENEILKQGYNHDTGDLNSITFDAIAVIKKDGRVSVKCSHGTGNILYRSSDLYQNTYSGVLIHV